MVIKKKNEMVNYNRLLKNGRLNKKRSWLSDKERNEDERQGKGWKMKKE
jgi:hypothetical protein